MGLTIFKGLSRLRRTSFYELSLRPPSRIHTQTQGKGYDYCNSMLMFIFRANNERYRLMMVYETHNFLNKHTKYIVIYAVSDV